MPRIGLILTILLLSGGCALGPDYQQPETDIPESYRHPETAASVEGQAKLQTAMPADDLPKGEWWKIYLDPVLDELQLRAAAGNQDLRAALARLEQARAVARFSKADLMPRLDLQPSARRGQAPEDLSPGGLAVTTNTFTLPLDLAYEIDLWGRLRRQSEAAGAEFAASRAEVENFRLILHGEIARNYFTLRILDAEIATVGRNVELRRQNQRLVTSRFTSGLSDRLDMSRAETELATAEAELISLSQRRNEIEHALALLLGEATSRFILPPTPAADPPRVPAVAAGLPAELLQRRPDVAAAERRLMAASARIGVAKAAFFPAIRLTGSAGYGSNELNALLNSGNRFWNIGPTISLPIFDGGRNRARLDQARAAYEEALANYRQTILQALREVDDALSALRLLSDQLAAQNRAIAFARQSVELSHRRYRVGLVSYLEVIESERTSLALERAALLATGQRLQANLALVKALGGGWIQAQ